MRAGRHRLLISPDKWAPREAIAIAYQLAEQLYTGAVEGVSELAREAQQEIGATPLAQSHADRSTPRA
jgi:hypothetical protein